jgi:hypothetical protein
MQVPDIAICIPTRNQGEFISGALRSAFSQVIQPVDVVVSEDAGTDDTALVVKRFRETLPAERRQLLRYERSAVQLGIGGNFDRAVQLARGEFVVKLDSDDILEADFSAVLAERLQANPGAGWAHCNIWNIRADGSTIGLAHSRKKSGFYPAPIAFTAYLRHNDTCHCVMIRKSAYLSVGGYRPEMKTCEDWLLWLEMLLSGWGYCFDKRPLARMRKHELRPALMSKRRLDFLASIRFMKCRMKELSREKLTGAASITPEAAMRAFAATAARLCVSSACDEAERAVRRGLFEAAIEFSPSFKNCLWLLLGPPLPASATRFITRLAGLPRRSARTFLQSLLSRLE